MEMGVEERVGAMLGDEGVGIDSLYKFVNGQFQ